MDKKRVLIIDDEIDFCLILQSHFLKRNCDVNFSHTLRDGLGFVNTYFPDIVILDNNLPDGLGWPAAKNILEAAPGVNLFLISANKTGNGKNGTGNNDDDGKQNGYHIIEKPISISQIDNILKE